ncbi:hypothetical protein JVT61DRAFT_12234 [Boletus reticuloceps]|uniref:Uncharacterized protein n=1 Tax=Boletus reticuloceps TaxID=495285 RepID=A0A8I3A385_9AGAM|nr:hypothetical protein JVT61DRAFT_12234 [Boletus reticuloceps]
MVLKSRALIKGPPMLFIKYQMDENRIPEVVPIPPLMNLDLYLQMRILNSVLTKSVAAVRHFMAATSPTNTNSTKVLELEDEVIALSAVCAWICALAGSKDLCA